MLVSLCQSCESILSKASFSFSSVAQSDMRMYRSPLLPNMNPGVMNTRALYSTLSAKDSDDCSSAGMRPQRNSPRCPGSNVQPKRVIIFSAILRREA